MVRFDLEHRRRWPRETEMEEQKELMALGWDEDWQWELDKLGDVELTAVRVASAEHGSCLVLGRGEPARAPVAGSFFHGRFGEVGSPAVGDWAAARDKSGSLVVERILPRRSSFVRQAGGPSSACEVIAANLDLLLVVTAVGRDFNPRRLERYAAAAFSGGVKPLIVINKSDQEHDRDDLLGRAIETAPGVQAVLTSTVREDGLDELMSHLGPGLTVGLVGSSGVGKSSLINRLLGEAAQTVREIREADGKGRHTTTRRELVTAPGGLILVDTPGLREIGLAEGSGLDEVFAEVAELAERCRFRDCSHQGEPGCAVQEALASGLVLEGRVRNYLRLLKETADNERRREERGVRDGKDRWKPIHKAVRSRQKLHRKLGLKE